MRFRDEPIDLLAGAQRCSRAQAATRLNAWGSPDSRTRHTAEALTTRCGAFAPLRDCAYGAWTRIELRDSGARWRCGSKVVS